MNPFSFLSSLFLLCLLSTIDFSIAQKVSNLLETAKEDGNFQILLDVLERTNLTPALLGGVYTIFAPTDAAFQALPEEVIADLLLDTESDRLTEILLYHIVPQVLLSSDLEDGMELPTVEFNSETIAISTDVTRTTFMVNQATIIEADIVTSNGVIHVIDDLLIPSSFPELFGNETFDNDGNATLVDMNETIVGVSARAANPIKLPDIPTLAIEDRNFNFLVAALGATDLVDALTATDLTLFAPLDEAFLKLPPALVDALLLEKNADLLTSILLYHVAPGTFTARDLIEQAPARLNIVAESELSIDFVAGTVLVDNASVIIPDLLASNGIVHAIDTVLLPPGIENALALLLEGGSPQSPGTTATNETSSTASDVLSFVEEIPELAVFASAWDSVIDDLQLDVGDNYTILAPTNDAFATITTRESNLELIDVLSYHIIPGQYLSSDFDLMMDGNVTTLSGEIIRFSVSTHNDTAAMLQLNGIAQVVDSDLITSDGTILHIVDQVLTPSQS